MSPISARIIFESPAEGWVEATCSCGWTSGRSVSGNRTKQAAADHAEDDHNILIDPRSFAVPSNFPE